MKKFILNYHIELYTLFVCIVALSGFQGVYEFTQTRKLLLLIIVIGVLHEYEEKKYPGGFFENLGKVWGWDMEHVDLRKPGQWVVCAWLLIAFVPYIFDHVIGLLLAPMFLGVFEMIVHTAGKKICSIKGWYVPGIVTAWIMGIVSIYCIYQLNQIYTITFIDYLIGIVCVALVMITLQIFVQKSAHYSLSQMIAHMKGR